MHWRSAFALVAEHSSSNLWVFFALSAPTSLPLLRHMAAVLELLRYQNFVAEEEPGTSTEGKFGIPRFNGEPTRLSEYSFRVRARMFKEKSMSKEEREKLGPLGLCLVEGLTGTALRWAQTMSLEDLAKDDGPDKLLSGFETQLKPKRTHQARELYAAGAAVHGLLSRQSGEPMASFILRRKTWYRCLLDCSQQMALPDLVLAEQLLASASISHDHQLLDAPRCRASSRSTRSQTSWWRNMRGCTSERSGRP